MLQEIVEYGSLVLTTAAFHIINLVIILSYTNLPSETVAMTRNVIRRVTPIFLSLLYRYITL